MMAHWLLKSEPRSYGWDDLVRDGATEWDGVRNHAAAGHLRAMQAGDEAIFYHSGDDKAAVGIARTAGATRWRRGPVGIGRTRTGPPARPAGDAGGDEGRAGAGGDGDAAPVAAVGVPRDGTGMACNRSDERDIG